jgi:hypothetical protein
MDFKKQVIDQINHHHKSIGYDVDSKGYLKTPEDNLIDNFPNWEEIKKEIKDGGGGELSLNDGIIKFHAVHSSCALCVNNFAMVKHHKDNISLFESSAFDVAQFEKKLSTGISTPNLDFYLRNDTSVIGIESKFTEILEATTDHTNKNLEKYLTAKLKLPAGFNDIIEYYINCKEKLYLDTAQLLKHMIGMFNEAAEVKAGAKLSLIYLYWVPDNWKKFEIYQKHEEELKKFKEQISGFSVKFEAYSYIDFWETLEKNEELKEYVDKIKDRYSFELY